VPSLSRDCDLQTAAFSLLERAPCVLSSIPPPTPHEKPRLGSWEDKRLGRLRELQDQLTRLRASRDAIMLAGAGASSRGDTGMRGPTRLAGGCRSPPPYSGSGMPQNPATTGRHVDDYRYSGSMSTLVQSCPGVRPYHVLTTRIRPLGKCRRV
jgi:hypothetical protein